MGNIETAAEKLGGLRLPPELEPLEVVGEGSCSITFRANYRGDTVAMKVYRPEVIERFKKKHGSNIAVHEMSQNRAFRKIPELLPFTAKPLAVMGHDGKCSLMFLQEFITGVKLSELAERNKGIPESVLEAGETIVRDAELNDIHQLDLDANNVLVRKQSGRWLPVFHDFNHVPRKESASNPLLKFALKTGMRKKSHQAYKQLEQWRALSSQSAR